MGSKRFAGLITRVALGMALIASLGPPNYVNALARLSRGLDAALPVLAIGALVKYLYSSKDKAPKPEDSY